MATKEKENLEEKKDKGMNEQDKTSKKDNAEFEQKNNQDKEQKKDNKDEGGCCGG